MLIGKPTGNNSKRFAFKLKMSEKQSLLAIHEKESMSNNTDYIDILSAMLYVDGEQNIDIRAFLRILLFFIAQRYSIEEVKEMLSLGVSGEFDTHSFLSIADTPQTRKYMQLALSLSKESHVYTNIVGDKGLYADEELFERLFVQHLKMPQSEESANVGEQPHTEEETLAESDRANSQVNGGNQQEVLNNLRKNIENLEVSPLSKAFMSAIVQAGQIGAMEQEDIDNYICTMLHGIGLVIPNISEEEIEKMVRELKEHINKRVEQILHKNMEHFDRVDTDDQRENVGEKK